MDTIYLIILMFETVHMAVTDLIKMQATASFTVKEPRAQQRLTILTFRFITSFITVRDAITNFDN